MAQNKQFNQMKKFPFFLTVLLTVIGLQSCSNADEPQAEVRSTHPDFEVVTIPAQSVTSRSGNENNSETILKFKDEDAAERTLQTLKEMDNDQKKEFFHKIGFEGGYMLLQNCDRELDVAFDAAEAMDSISGRAHILNCVARYQGVMAFDNLEEDDVTPSLPYRDERAELLGNNAGQIMIGDEVVAPRAAAPINMNIVEYKNAVVSVKNGHYTSYFRLGRIAQNMGFKLETYRRIIGIKKSDNNCCYDGYLEIWSNGHKETAVIKNGRGQWKLYSLASAYTPRINMRMTNFSSTRNSNNKVSKTVENILVR